MIFLKTYFLSSTTYNSSLFFDEWRNFFFSVLWYIFSSCCSGEKLSLQVSKSSRCFCGCAWFSKSLGDTPPSSNFWKIFLRRTLKFRRENEEVYWRWWGGKLKGMSLPVNLILQITKSASLLNPLSKKLNCRSDIYHPAVPGYRINIKPPLPV